MKSKKIRNKPENSAHPRTPGYNVKKIQVLLMGQVSEDKEHWVFF